MSEELISIICTVKNGEQTISDTIKSVIDQTYKNWEMIIIDDGSTDNTKLILESYLKKERKIKPYFTKAIGRGSALNKAVELTSGDYIVNLDADDVIHPQKLEIQINIFKENKELFLIATKGIIIYNKETPSWNKIEHYDNNYEVIDNKVLLMNPINHSSVMINKMKLIDLGKYDISRQTQFDYELWLRAYNQNLKMIKLDYKLTAKRIHSNQSFENKKRIRYLANASKLQIYYIYKLRKFYFFPVPILNFSKGLLPFKLRRLISDKVTNLRGFK